MHPTSSSPTSNDVSFDAMAQRAPSSVSDTHYCVVGDVTIEASAAIAPGVVLQAASGSRIVVGKGTCLAAGVCIQSRGGLLTIAAGVSLGANVLVIGQGSVGVNACVSPGSTLINPAVAADAILPPNALVGKSPTSTVSPSSSYSVPSPASGSGKGHPSAQSNSYQSSGYQSSSEQSNSYQSSGYQSNSYQNDSYQSNDYSANQGVNGSWNNGVQSSYGSETSLNGAASHAPYQDVSDLAVRRSYDRVYGREQVAELISTLFPNRQSLNNPPEGR